MLLLQAISTARDVQLCTFSKTQIEEWRELQKSPMLAGPWQQSTIPLPTGMTLDDEGERANGEAEKEERVKVVEEDFEASPLNRWLNATITLHASQYCGKWSPLTCDIRRLFPSRPSRADMVTFYHRCGRRIVPGQGGLGAGADPAVTTDISSLICAWGSPRVTLLPGDRQVTHLEAAMLPPEHPDPVLVLSDIVYVLK